MRMHMLSVALLFALAQETAPPEPAPAPAPAPAPDSSTPAPITEPPPIEPRTDEDCDDDERTVEPPCPPATGADGADDDAATDDDEEEDDDGDDGIEVGPAEPEDDDPLLRSEARLTFGGRLGAAAGNVLAVPFFVPGPGGYVTGSQRLVAFNLLFAGADGGLSLGLDEQSTTSVAGYKVRMLAGLRLSFDWIAFEADMHGGLTSVALVPVPRFGLGAETRLALPLCCDDERIVTLDAEGRFDADLLLIAPAPALSVEGGATWYIGPVFLRGRAGIDADAVIALIANTVSASVFASITLGLNLDLID
jgi:hypothetical protein